MKPMTLFVLCCSLTAACSEAKVDDAGDDGTSTNLGWQEGAIVDDQLYDVRVEEIQYFGSDWDGTWFAPDLYVCFGDDACTAACTKISANDVTGGCCSCSGVTKAFKKAAWNVHTFLCL